MFLPSPATAPAASPDPLGTPHAAWTAALVARGIKRAHADAVWADVHRRLRTAIEPGPALPARVVRALEEAGIRLETPTVARSAESSDGFTRKFLLRLGDGQTVETVLMRYTGRATACLSTQAGCAMGCVFCATGQAGFRRHLTAGEIVAQALHVARVLAAEGRRLRNIVLMGQGEPLHNHEAVTRAITILTDTRGLALAGPRISLSTVGLVPGILRLAEENCPASLAVSLHGATDEERNALVPVGRRWPLAELMAACREYSARTGRYILFEWTLIAGHNDGERSAEALARLLDGQRAHVNLIPLNPTGGFSGTPTGAGAAGAFQAVLRRHGIPSTVRQRRGIDIAAGCGQLAAAG